jgi:hypothetical protein
MIGNLVPLAQATKSLIANTNPNINHEVPKSRRTAMSCIESRASARHHAAASVCLAQGCAGWLGDVKSNSELEFLTAIERGAVVTQMTLRKRIGVSIGLINALLKQGMHKGYVKARKVPFKRYAYYVTILKIHSPFTAELAIWRNFRTRGRSIAACLGGQG